jgi:tRNA-uridine 2-sulfurtransferase
MLNDTITNHNDRLPRVVVAMSGGVDSSVAAALLVEQGYDVVGMMMRLWSEPGPGGTAVAQNRCCTPDQIADARRVAHHLDIPFYVIDVKDHFRNTVVQYFIDEHARGRTPNPCLECNRQIRFTYLLNQALSLDARYLATGHYARIRHAEDGYQLLKAVDANKDQSYVLSVLGQQELAHVLFPVGDYTKEEVRRLADRFGLPVAQKKESMDLCFLADNDYRAFLRRHAPDSNRPGPIFNEQDEEVGRHDGLAFYTIGQRKGLGIAAAAALFVLRKDVKRNALIVGPHDALGRRELWAHTVNWIAGTAADMAIHAAVKIRYKATPIAATVRSVAAGRVHIRFDEPVFGITAGQGAVFYQGDLCLGGGIIAGDDSKEPVPLIDWRLEPAREPKLIAPADICLPEEK